MVAFFPSSWIFAVIVCTKTDTGEEREGSPPRTIAVLEATTYFSRFLCELLTDNSQAGKEILFSGASVERG